MDTKFCSNIKKQVDEAKLVARSVNDIINSFKEKDLVNCKNGHIVFNAKKTRLFKLFDKENRKFLQENDIKILIVDIIEETELEELQHENNQIIGDKNTLKLLVQRLNYTVNNNLIQSVQF